MEKTGLIERVFARQELNFRNYQALHNSPEAVSYNEGLQESIKLLKEIYNAKDIHLALGVERLFLEHEFHLYANSPEEVQSIKAAITQFSDAQNSLKAVQDSYGYRIAASTYSIKRLANGVPIDSFHEFLNSHATRLTNRMASQLSVTEKDVLRQRKENLQMIKKLYISLQRKVLEIKNID